MRHSIVPLSLLVFSLSFAGNLSAQKGERCIDRVTPAGSETLFEFVEPCNNENPMPYTPPGVIWNYTDNGLKWIPRNVAVGDRGTQVLAICELNNEQVDLLSIFDSDPPTPIWTDTSIFETDAGYMCSSSFKPLYHVVMYHVNSPDIMNRIPKVNCYTSSSTTPIWTWSYEQTINAGTKVAIDRDATVVAIAIYNDNTSMVDLYFLDPATGNELGTYSAAWGSLRGFDLSADGSTLYIHEGGTNVHIFDIASLSVIFDTTTAGSFDGHCISGDGTKFAFGGFGTVKIWEYMGGSWSSYTYNTGSGNYGDEMDFSDDGSTLGFGVSQYSPSYTKTEAYIMDIDTKTITAHVVNSSSGGYQDVCSAAAISHDGKYFALARWGDQFNTHPEVQILENGVGLVGSIDCRGSAFGVDISWDGQITVVGNKAVHANVSGNGGDVYCYDLGGEDMDLLGLPRIGDTVEINVFTGPNWFYALMMGTADDPNGAAFTPYGILYLNIEPPNFFLLLPTMEADPTGFGSALMTVCDTPALIGHTLFFQSLFSPDGAQLELSEDYLTLTLLP